MTDWSQFIYYAAVAVALWAAGAWAAWRGRSGAVYGFTAAGLAVMGAFIAAMWAALDRPPMRTMGETRLWYALFLPMAGLVVYSRWRYRWVMTFAVATATVFVAVNLCRPEIHAATLMPALQSPWFAPHVIVYMMAYALLGAAALLALYMLCWPKGRAVADGGLAAADSLVSSGLAFLTVGMLFGALWAKEAWGHYWSWDPKETWAAVTWLAYLAYLHYRLLPGARRPLALAMLVVAFLLLQMCWWGINYLPSAMGASVHTYS